MKVFILLLLSMFSLTANYAQEINARIDLSAPQAQNVNPRTVELLQRVIFDFLNNRAWTNHRITNDERIDCGFNIVIHSFDGASRYTASAQITSSRPIYGTNYNSPILSFKDNYFNFTYTEGEQLDFSDTQSLNSLTSILAFYAYTIIGMDLDTFQAQGGSQYFSKANEIVNYSQSLPQEGWRGMDAMDSRYWLINNLLDSRYAFYREFAYKYHHLGLDHMSKNEVEAKELMADLVLKLGQVDRFMTGNVLTNALFTAKSNEFAGIFTKMPGNESLKIYNALVKLDPSNANKYDNLKN